MATKKTPGGWKPGQSGNPAGLWKPGQSGNPAGRPRGAVSKLKEAIERKLAEKRPRGDETREETIADTLITIAEAGDLKAIEMLLDRTWPKSWAIELGEDTGTLARDILEARQRAFGKG